MKTISYKDPVQQELIGIAYCDYGSGQPVVLIHGWPLSKEMWEYQWSDLVDNGNRVISYDRRGFGSSSKPWLGYDYDSLAADLDALIVNLDLREVILVGFSMGSGEVARYLKHYGRNRISSVVLISPVLPFLMKTNGNPSGVDPAVFSEMISGIKTDRIGFLETFLKDFFGTSLLNKPVDKPLQEYYRGLAARAAMHATVHCITSFSATDFRPDLEAMDLPVLLVHGDKDAVVPREASSDRLTELLPQVQYAVYADAPHGLFYTHRGRLNKDLVNFINGIPYQQDTQESLPPVIPPILF
ncbi:alpha/beta hydrolase [Niabella sp. CC-SYL272]|uniref:alpha/beta fold hydrolase n=1 Tax=Niabella agricola TaxID=2891571 RepID=UPI001F227C35|nr:alpha/beta hydrolase [Niabella agricola]MCF3108323.1 alpha/beta hydrolase [Niabella agricola]